MSSNRALSAVRSSGRLTAKTFTSRNLATIASPVSAARAHKIVVIGGGTAGLGLSHQLLRSGRFRENDIAVIDPAMWHHYQAGWTLVGGGIKTKQELRRPLEDLVDGKIKFYNDKVATLTPGDNFVTLGNGDKIGYEQLVVVPGININYKSIKGLPEALADPSSMVSSIYGYETCDKVFSSMQKLKRGRAIFTQPTGVVKCAGAPQKIMWLALDYWKRAKLYQSKRPSEAAIGITFATGLPAMFGVPKYSATLEGLRKERGVEGLFQHDLVSIDGNNATFARADGSDPIVRHFDFLHAVPKMGAHDFVKKSEIANEAGFVDVDEATTRSTKFPNVWSIGDASGLPTSKTTAAITSQTPVLVRNLMDAMDGKAPKMVYDGYTSCPLVTDYNNVLLAEFKYGGVPKETFSRFGLDQSVPQRPFYYLKKYFFPWVYYQYMVKGAWAGPNGWISQPQTAYK